MRHVSYFGRTDWCGQVVSSLDTVAALWKLCLCSIAPAWLNMPEPSSSDRLSPSQFSWWNVPLEAELSHSPLSLRFAHRHLSSPEITSCRSLPNKNTFLQSPAVSLMCNKYAHSGAKANRGHNTNITRSERVVRDDVSRSHHVKSQSWKQRCDPCKAPNNKTSTNYRPPPVPLSALSVCRQELFTAPA